VGETMNNGNAGVTTTARRPPFTVGENAKLLTVSLCHLHMERIDELISKRGELTRYIEAREFFARNLQMCLRRRDEAHNSHFGE
jgi:hypothetical protein